ncbi:unnamed protein product [Amoebophrya sp. A120]|nr:unnamed protein product [Amoebophrya sp. A120]|eukprot:GSA120T00007186001.1
MYFSDVKPVIILEPKMRNKSATTSKSNPAAKISLASPDEPRHVMPQEQATGTTAPNVVPGGMNSSKNGSLMQVRQSTSSSLVSAPTTQKVVSASSTSSRSSSGSSTRRGGSDAKPKQKSTGAPSPRAGATTAAQLHLGANSKNNHYSVAAAAAANATSTTTRAFSATTAKVSNSAGTTSTSATSSSFVPGGRGRLYLQANKNGTQTPGFGPRQINHWTDKDKNTYSTSTSASSSTTNGVAAAGEKTKGNNNKHSTSSNSLSLSNSSSSTSVGSSSASGTTSSSSSSSSRGGGKTSTSSQPQEATKNMNIFLPPELFQNEELLKYRLPPPTSAEALRIDQQRHGNVQNSAVLLYYGEDGTDPDGATGAQVKEDEDASAVVEQGVLVAAGGDEEEEQAEFYRSTEMIVEDDAIMSMENEEARSGPPIQNPIGGPPLGAAALEDPKAAPPAPAQDDELQVDEKFLEAEEFVKAAPEKIAESVGVTTKMIFERIEGGENGDEVAIAANVAIVTEEEDNDKENDHSKEELDDVLEHQESTTTKAAMTVSRMAATQAKETTGLQQTILDARVNSYFREQEEIDEQEEKRRLEVAATYFEAAEEQNVAAGAGAPASLAEPEKEINVSKLDKAGGARPTTNAVNYAAVASSNFAPLAVAPPASNAHNDLSASSSAATGSTSFMLPNATATSVAATQLLAAQTTAANAAMTFAPASRVNNMQKNKYSTASSASSSSSRQAEKEKIIIPASGVNGSKEKSGLPHIEIIRNSKVSIEKYLAWEKDNARFLTVKLRDQEIRYNTLEQAERAREELRVNLFRFLDPELPQRVDLIKDLQKSFNSLAVECSRGRAEASRLRELLHESQVVYRAQEEEVEKLRENFDVQIASMEQRVVSLTTVNSALQAKIEALVEAHNKQLKEIEENEKLKQKAFHKQLAEQKAFLEQEIAKSKTAFFEEQNNSQEKLQLEETKWKQKIADKDHERLGVEQKLEEKAQEIEKLKIQVEEAKEANREEVANYVIERDTLSGELREFIHEREQYQTEITVLKQDIERMKKEHDELHTEHMKLVTLEKSETEEMEVERKRLRDDRKAAEEQVRFMEDRMRSFDQERLVMAEKLQALEVGRVEQSKREEHHMDKFASTVGELERERMAAAELRVVHIANVESIKSLQIEKAALEKSNEKLEKEAVAYRENQEKAYSDLSASYSGAEKTNEELKDLLTKMRQLNSEVTSTLKERENEIEILKRDLETEKTNAHDLSNSVKQHSAAIQQLRGHSVKLHEEKETAVDELKTEIDALTKTHTEEVREMREDLRKKTEEYAKKIETLETEIDGQSLTIMKKGDSHLEAQRKWEETQERLVAERDDARKLAHQGQGYKYELDMTRQQLAVAEQQLEDTRQLLQERSRTDQLRKSAIGALLQTVQMDQMVGASSMGQQGSPAAKSSSPAASGSKTVSSASAQGAPGAVSSTSNTHLAHDAVNKMQQQVEQELAQIPAMQQALQTTTADHQADFASNANEEITAATVLKTGGQVTTTDFSTVKSYQQAAGADSQQNSNSNSSTNLITPIQLHYPERVTLPVSSYRPETRSTYSPVKKQQELRSVTSHQQQEQEGSLHQHPFPVAIVYNNGATTAAGGHNFATPQDAPITGHNLQGSLPTVEIYHQQTHLRGPGSATGTVAPGSTTSSSSTATRVMNNGPSGNNADFHFYSGPPAGHQQQVLLPDSDPNLLPAVTISSNYGQHAGTPQHLITDNNFSHQAFNHTLDSRGSPGVSLGGQNYPHSRTPPRGRGRRRLSPGPSYGAPSGVVTVDNADHLTSSSHHQQSAFDNSSSALQMNRGVVANNNYPLHVFQQQQDQQYDRNVSKAISEAETILTNRDYEHNVRHAHDDAPRRVSQSSVMTQQLQYNSVDQDLLTRLRQERRKSIERAMMGSASSAGSSANLSASSKERQLQQSQALNSSGAGSSSGIFDSAPVEPPSSFFDWLPGL